MRIRHDEKEEYRGWEQKKPSANAYFVASFVVSLVNLL